MNLRVFGLGAAVALTALLPLVAVAGPADGPDPLALSTGEGHDDGDDSGARAAGAGDGGDARSARTGAGANRTAAGDSATTGSAKGLLAGIDTAGAPSARSVPSGPSAPPAPAGAGRVVRCGPELASPHGVEAQTCVLTEGAGTWARTYYRNATGDELAAVLSLMGPGGRTVQTHCAVPAEDEPGSCETPKERTRGKSGEYTAVSEFAKFTGSGDITESPLLLRSGSNSPGPAAS
ncbi:hypothetical protein [Streptomyces sp. SP18CS02]|uniref:hypothetical protein n=1 Tax=Streptomyces sp. SP18CS02 TaxID=3002531 RepID=UPI002E771671|nr:hypothetical protein [Streptomyces sp. SP18CS02]MEE1754286.1 hypothetical protein [Streptomyces sp. SP18CS02]